MNQKKKAEETNMSAGVDFQTFDLDGQVHDLMWCGYQDEVVLMHTAEGSVYRSRDRGLSWKRLKSLLAKQGAHVADDDQDVSAHSQPKLTSLSFAADWPSSQADPEPHRRPAGCLRW